jgi:hypothetical protein
VSGGDVERFQLGRSGIGSVGVGLVERWRAEYRLKVSDGTRSLG